MEGDGDGKAIVSSAWVGSAEQPGGKGARGKEGHAMGSCFYSLQDEQSQFGGGVAGQKLPSPLRAAPKQTYLWDQGGQSTGREGKQDKTRLRKRGGQLPWHLARHAASTDRNGARLTPSAKRSSHFVFVLCFQQKGRRRFLAYRIYRQRPWYVAGTISCVRQFCDNTLLLLWGKYFPHYLTKTELLHCYCPL